MELKYPELFGKSGKLSKDERQKKCCVLGCRSKRVENPDVKFFHCPRPAKNPIRMETWKKFTQNPSVLKEDIHKYHRLFWCGLHFKRNDFTNDKLNQLNRDAVPSIFNVEHLRKRSEKKKESQIVKSIPQHKPFILKRLLSQNRFNSNNPTIQNKSAVKKLLTPETIDNDDEVCASVEVSEAHQSFGDYNNDDDENEVNQCNIDMSIDECENKSQVDSTVSINEDRSRFEKLCSEGAGNIENMIRDGTARACNKDSIKHNTDGICRVCGYEFKNKEYLFPLLAGFAKANGIVQMVNEYLPIMVQQEGSLPKSICCFCLKHVTDWDQFVENCKRFDLKVHDIFDTQRSGLNKKYIFSGADHDYFQCKSVKTQTVESGVVCIDDESNNDDMPDSINNIDDDAGDGDGDEDESASNDLCEPEAIHSASENSTSDIDKKKYNDESDEEREMEALKANVKDYQQIEDLISFYRVFIFKIIDRRLQSSAGDFDNCNNVNASVVLNSTDFTKISPTTINNNAALDCAVNPAAAAVAVANIGSTLLPKSTSTDTFNNFVKTEKYGVRVHLEKHGESEISDSNDDIPEIVKLQDVHCVIIQIYKYNSITMKQTPLIEKSFSVICSCENGNNQLADVESNFTRGCKKNTSEQIIKGIYLETLTPAYGSRVSFEPGFIVLKLSMFLSSCFCTFFFSKLKEMLNMELLTKFDCKAMRVLFNTKVKKVMETLEESKMINIKSVMKDSLPLIQNKTIFNKVPAVVMTKIQRKLTLKKTDRRLLLKNIRLRKLRYLRKVHKQKVTSKWKCDVCEKDFAKKSVLKHHKWRWHTEQHCNHCDVKFPSLRKLREHKTLIKNQEKLTCNECNLQFKTTEKYKRHNLIKHNIGEYLTCEECGKQYLTTLSLWTHKRNVHRSGTSLCPHCGTMIHGRNLQKHIEAIHLMTRKTTCPICSKVLPNKTYLQRHLRGHNRPQGLCCSVCYEQFETAEEVKSHFQQEHDCDGVTDVFSLKCNVCGKEGFRLPGALMSHLQFHHFTEINKKPDLNELPCLICKSTFSDGKLLILHMLTHANDDKVRNIVGEKMKKRNIKCGLCEQYTTNRKNLAIHEFFGHNKWPFKCKNDLCDEKLWSKAFLDIHLNEKHSLDLLACTMCDTKFTDSLAKKTHMKLVHNKDNFEDSDDTSKPKRIRRRKRDGDSGEIICELCDKTFRTSWRLKTHMEIHSSGAPIKKYHCNICKKSFFDEIQLRTHTVHIHNENRQLWPCNVCNKVYRRKTTLVKHQLSRGCGGEQMCKVNVTPTLNCDDDDYDDDDDDDLLYDSDLAGEVLDDENSKTESSIVIDKNYPLIKPTDLLYSGYQVLNQSGIVEVCQVNQNIDFTVEDITEPVVTMYRCSECEVMFQTEMELNLHFQVKSHDSKLVQIVNINKS